MRAYLGGNPLGANGAYSQVSVKGWACSPRGQAEKAPSFRHPGWNPARTEESAPLTLLGMIAAWTCLGLAETQLLKHLQVCIYCGAN